MSWHESKSRDGLWCRFHSEMTYINIWDKVSYHADDASSKYLFELVTQFWSKTPGLRFSRAGQARAWPRPKKKKIFRAGRGPGLER